MPRSPLPSDTILLVGVGSTAHGTGLPGGEDYDQLGVVVEAPGQLLTTGRLTFPIQGEAADWPRAVRHGDIDFPQWWARTLELDQRLAALQLDTEHADRPDARRIDRWAIDTHLTVWNGLDRPDPEPPSQTASRTPQTPGQHAHSDGAGSSRPSTEPVSHRSSGWVRRCGG